MSPTVMMLMDPAAVWPFVFTLFGFGACVGSFLNVCIHRIPADESVVRPRSRCPGCRTPIAWYDNVPVLSWVLLRARCRTCGARIAGRYPLVEAATGGLAIAAGWAFGPGPHALVVFVFTAALLLVTFIDLDHFFIPDEVSLPGIAIGVAVSLLPDGIGPTDAIVGALLGGGILWLVAWGYERLTGVEGMGLGDVKLLAMIGAFLGWQAVPAVLVIASMTGAFAGVGLVLARGGSRASRRVVRRLGLRALGPHLRHVGRRTAIPFGPFLALGAVVVLYQPLLGLPLFFWLER
jgi:leader peptidase (prepilin peptidase)/N-methyltransferase